MDGPRFLQIHSLHGYSAALLNRDDSGLAKRISYGGTVRTRISSQCLKRHWRVTDSPYALDRIDGAEAAVRSREIVTRRVIDPLRENYDSAIVDAIEEKFQTLVYGEKGGKKSSRQPLLFGEPEIQYLRQEAEREAEKIAAGDPDGTPAKAPSLKEWTKKARANLKVMREGVLLPGGLVSAMFGRMVTSDPEANIDAAVHVAHSLTVHSEESESDYFTVVDDLHRDEDDAGADHIGETELTAGIFYGYVVIDCKGLLDNLGDDATMAGRIAERLVHLIATVSPGAKLGSTAPYSYAGWMLVEAGDWQPRSLAEAFRTPTKPDMAAAEDAVQRHLERLDEAYGISNERRWMSVSGACSVPGAERVSMDQLATWAGERISCRSSSHDG